LSPTHRLERKRREKNDKKHTSNIPSEDSAMTTENPLQMISFIKYFCMRDLNI